MPTLETKNLVLKPIEVSDAEAIFHFFTANVTQYMYPAPAKTIDDTLAFINHSIELRNQDKEIVFVARLKYDDTFVGCMGLHQKDTQTPELGIWIQEGLFGKNLGLEGMRAVIDYARKNIPHTYLVYPVDRRNVASRNIPESFGGIYKKAYPVKGMAGNELDIIEYWIYPKKPDNYPEVTFLFQGDSITDCNRKQNDLSSLGDGYVNLLKPMFPFVQLINKGVSGHRTEDLLNRWKKDTIMHKPDVLTLLCGINDVWHFYAFGKPINETIFEENYTKLIEWTKKELPQTRIVLIEPFSFSVEAFNPSWRPMLDQFIHVVRKLAKTYHLSLIKMDEHMKTWEKIYGAQALLGDGVHPTELGHHLIAKTIKPVLRNLLLEIQEAYLKS